MLYQKEHLAFTEMRSPYDGLVTRRDRDPGGVVVPGASILQLVATNEIWVSAWVDETAMAGLKPGQPARVVFRSEPGKSYAGEVARLGREADRETREFVVDVRVKELPENWTMGQRAEVFIETGRKSDVVVMPAAVRSVAREQSRACSSTTTVEARWRGGDARVARIAERWKSRKGFPRANKSSGTGGRRRRQRAERRPANQPRNEPRRP